MIIIIVIHLPAFTPTDIKELKQQAEYLFYIFVYFFNAKIYGFKLFLDSTILSKPFLAAVCSN